MLWCTEQEVGLTWRRFFETRANGSYPEPAEYTHPHSIPLSTYFNIISCETSIFGDKVASNVEYFLTFRQTLQLPSSGLVRGQWDVTQLINDIRSRKHVKTRIVIIISLSSSMSCKWSFFRQVYRLKYFTHFCTWSNLEFVCSGVFL